MPALKGKPLTVGTPVREWMFLAYQLGRARPADDTTKRFLSKKLGRGPEFGRVMGSVELTSLVRKMALDDRPQDDFEKQVRAWLAEAIDFHDGDFVLELKKAKHGRPSKANKDDVLRFLVGRYSQGIPLKSIWNEAAKKFGVHERNVRKIWQKRGG